MNMSEIMEGLRTKYQEEVKPAIESGNYELASMYMGYIVGVTELKRREIMSQVHMGTSFITTADLLCKALQNGEDIAGKMERFEAYSAQTKLPDRT